MLVIPAEQRLDALREFGLTEPLVRQSSGELVHPLLRFRCQGPPYYSYHGAGCPNGPLLVPIWDCGDTVTAVWKRSGRLEFIEFSIESHEKHGVLARSEQGFWATVFATLLEDSDEREESQLPEAAAAVEFRYLDRVIGLFNLTNAATLQTLVADIDCEVGGSSGANP